MKTSDYLKLVLPYTLLFPPPVLASLPYTPTKIIPAPNINDNLAYVFRPSSSSDTQSELVALDFSATFDSTSIPYTTLCPTLPFLSTNQASAYTPIVEGDGSLVVYTGGCSSGADGAQLWRYVQDQTGDIQNGTWAQSTLYQDLSVAGNSLTGANFLASGTSFSPYLSSNGSDENVYIFGGMCPDTNATQSSWTTSANYSGLMLKIDNQATVSSSQPIFDVGLSSSHAPPIPEAGFSVTALQPTFSNASDGIQSQQQNFILIGGHTQTAFINMSHLALFSLPEQSWAFLPIDQPSSAKTDLTVKQEIVQIDPRSGHTAVLTANGTSIIVFGGWVGDVGTPANPQLAVLELGAGFGGTGDWTWTVPKASEGGLAAGAGLYGHGAVMLPGNVMMVVGGYSITGATGSRVRRAQQTANTQNYFYNVTSNTWITSYTPPASNKAELDTSNTGPLSSTSQKAGLGAGVALGFAAVAVACLLAVWYARRLKRKREQHEKDMDNQTASTREYHSEDAEKHGSLDDVSQLRVFGYSNGRNASGRGPHPWPASDEKDAAGRPGWKRQNSQEAERTGLLLEVPSPTRGLRRSLSGKGSYHGSPRYDESKAQRGSGNIHVIDEREEEDNQSGRGTQKARYVGQEIIEAVGATILTNVPVLDPFRDPEPHPLRSNPVSPVADAGLFHDGDHSSPDCSPVEERKSEIQTWINNWTAAEARLRQHQQQQQHQHDGVGGRLSPDKSDRTNSSISEYSQRSFISSKSSSGHNGVGASVTRSISARSGSLKNTGPLLPSPNYEIPSPQSIGRAPPFAIPNFSKKARTAGSRPGTATTADTYTTAHTSFAVLQSEGEALLGGIPDGPYHAAAVASTHVAPAQRPFRSKSKVTWMGSVRRAFGSTNIPRDGPNDRRSASMNASTTSPYHDASSPARDFLASTASSPTEAHPQHSPTHSSAAPPVPRRAASDSTTMFSARKRGAKDWDFETLAARRRKEKQKYDWGAPEDRRAYEDVADVESEEERGEEWDVERAVEGRTVQFAFTVPRGSLRVVNRGPGDGVEGERREREREEGGGDGGGDLGGEGIRGKGRSGNDKGASG